MLLEELVFVKCDIMVTLSACRCNSKVICMSFLWYAGRRLPGDAEGGAGEAVAGVETLLPPNSASISFLLEAGVGAGAAPPPRPSKSSAAEVLAPGAGAAEPPDPNKSASRSVLLTVGAAGVDETSSSPIRLRS